MTNNRSTLATFSTSLLYLSNEISLLCLTLIKRHTEPIPCDLPEQEAKSESQGCGDGRCCCREGGGGAETSPASDGTVRPASAARSGGDLRVTLREDRVLTQTTQGERSGQT